MCVVVLQKWRRAGAWNLFADKEGSFYFGVFVLIFMKTFFL